LRENIHGSTMLIIQQLHSLALWNQKPLELSNLT
jgi:hypothetical protein